ncbi:hypothetical protein M8C21_011673 [Ambrosia artemisiifolia]|uniref:Uncharacterized protein n=1 Tax=Ambrosia artemisiifolia TaxID=4212 RepID=A0AAD5GAG6_AMBAR|nr:hypothetical protein M8C21_011673 [Ambrosia artemisiifolia]
MNRSNKTWVRNVCQKLEDICTDIDKLVCKEPVSFVGNQMETVGANVKNFFSGFVDDFGLTRVVDPVHVAQVIPSTCINLVESSTNSVADVKDDTVDSNTNSPKEAPLTHEILCHKPSSTSLHHSEQITSEISRLIGEKDSLINETSDDTAQVNLNSSTNGVNLDNRFEEGVVCDESLHGEAIENIIDLDLDIDNIMMNSEEKKTLLNRPINELECDSNTSNTNQSSEPECSVTCNENQTESFKHITASGLSSENLYESLNSSFRDFTVEPDTINCKPMDTMDYFSVSSDIRSSCGSFTTIDCDSNSEDFASCSGTVLADDSMVDFEDVKYDTVESDVIVEGGKLSSFTKTSRSKSYKKMIQDAFMSRKRLTKEYKQLGIQYGDIDKELCQPTQSSKPPAQDLPDSEWELL